MYKKIGLLAIMIGLYLLNAVLAEQGFTIDLQTSLI